MATAAVSVIFFMVLLVSVIFFMAISRKVTGFRLQSYNVEPGQLM